MSETKTVRGPRSRRLLSGSFLLAACALAGCEFDAPPPPAFRFKVAEAWPMQVAEDVIAQDRVLVVGEATNGTIQVGDRAIVPGEAGEIFVTVEAIRIGEDGETEAQRASEGEIAVLELRGVGPDVEWSGEELVGLPRVD